MLNALHSQRGVTLIELMIGLTIAAILFTIGAPSFSDWIQNTRIHNSAESIMSGLQLARSEAVRRNAQVTFQLEPSNDPGWTVGCIPTTTNCSDAIIQSRTSTEGSTAGIAASPLEVDATTGSVAGSGVFNGTLTFNGLGRVTTTGSNATLTVGNNATIDITNPGIDDCMPVGTMRCLRIVVSSGGQIRMCNPAVSLSSNPQGCSS